MNKFIVSLIGLSFCQSAFAIDCFGTEPFWNAEVTSTKISLDIGSQTDYPVTSVSGAQGMTEAFIEIFSDSRGPLAIVKSEICNDGMSDNHYEKEVLIFTATGALYGCCGPAIEPSDIN